MRGSFYYSEVQDVGDHGDDSTKLRLRDRVRKDMALLGLRDS